MTVSQLEYTRYFREIITKNFNELQAIKKAIKTFTFQQAQLLLHATTYRNCFHYPLYVSQQKYLTLFSTV